MREPTFLQMAEEVLNGSSIPLRPTKIWVICKDKFNKSTTSNNPVATLQASILTSIKNDNKTPFFMDTDADGFIIYGLKDIHRRDQDVECTIQAIINGKRKERDLHPFLAYHQHYYNNQTLTKTIFHEKSQRSKKGINGWTFPDMVGVQFHFLDWGDKLTNVAEKITYGDLFKLISYEIKLELNFSNFREAFFQTLSNSGWANEAFLVARQIESDEEFRRELKQLSVEHGVGIIELNDNPDNSFVLFQPTTRPKAITERIKKLKDLNIDFETFLKGIEDSLKIHRPLSEPFDTILDLQEFKQYNNNEEF